MAFCPVSTLVAWYIRAALITLVLLLGSALPIERHVVVFFEAISLAYASWLFYLSYVPYSHVVLFG